jgi:hypothetical protein
VNWIWIDSGKSKWCSISGRRIKRKEPHILIDNSIPLHPSSGEKMINFIKDCKSSSELRVSKYSGNRLCMSCEEIPAYRKINYSNHSTLICENCYNDATELLKDAKDISDDIYPFWNSKFCLLDTKNPYSYMNSSSRLSINRDYIEGEMIEIGDREGRKSVTNNIHIKLENFSNFYSGLNSLPCPFAKRGKEDTDSLCPICGEDMDGIIMKFDNIHFTSHYDCLIEACESIEEYIHRNNSEIISELL